MSARKVIKKYVVLVRSKTEGGDDRNFRSVAMTHGAAMSEIAELGRDGIKAWCEEAGAEDLKPLAVAKQRLKERKQRKVENDACRLFSEEWFAKNE